MIIFSAYYPKHHKLHITMKMDSLIKLYSIYAGEEPSSCETIAAAGSNRQYYRITSRDKSRTVIGVAGTSFEENQAFIYLSQHFKSIGLPVPEVFAVSDNGLDYLQTDLGHVSLYDALKVGRENTDGYSQQDIELLKRTIRLLPKIQVCGGTGLDFSQCYPVESMDEQNILFDLNYFKYCFLKTTSVEFNEVKLESCFQEMSKCLGRYDGNYFMYRDFQARNVMLNTENEPCFIDYQGGRRGPLQYDLVSFLWQASSHFSTEIRNTLIDEYISSLCQYIDFDEAEFRKSISQWVLFRILQVLGAYGFRGKYERKKYFLDSIPAAISNLHDILEDPGSCPYPYLYEILRNLVELPEFNKGTNVDISKSAPTISSYDNQGVLKVKVFSFSYRKGIPLDDSGNGGGYVFDCRSTHNPGKYEPYKNLTGLDKPVIDFLETDGEITTFLSSVYKLADAHVCRYMERGFTSLMFCFGCTGGQHRSVYSAQHLAEYINNKYGIEVSIVHREQGISQILQLRRKAMIFAAGLGTRLRPLTDDKPKALVEVSGKTLLEHVVHKLVSNGFNDIVINVHHFAEQIEDWVEMYKSNAFIKDNNVRFYISDERNKLLDTGGAISNASHMLVSGNPEQRFLVHNVDILSNIKIEHLLSFSPKDADAILLVSKRETTRYLVFNANMELVGWINTLTGEVKSPYESVKSQLMDANNKCLDLNGYHLRAFAGIHMIGTVVFNFMPVTTEKFSIIDFYLNNCTRLKILGYEPDNMQLVDVGKLDSLACAEQFLFDNR